MLAYPNLDSEHILYTDVSGDGLGAVLSQLSDGEQKYIAYWNETLSPAKNCCITRELLSDVEARTDNISVVSPYKLRPGYASLFWLT